MQTRFILLALALLTGASVVARANDTFEVAIGDDLASVKAALGEPQGYMLSGTRAVLTYDRGKVELRDDKVVSVDLVSAEVAATRKAEAKAARREREARRAEQGVRLRDAKLNDPDFLFLPASRQFAFWRSFRKQYPAVDLTPAALPELAMRVAAEERELEAEAQARQEADLLALEWRVQEAEAKAEEAALAARRAETRSRSTGFYSGWHSTRWPTTVVIGGYPEPCPPVAVPYHDRCSPRAPTVQPHGRTVFGGFSSGASFHQSSSGTSFFPTQKQ